ncbi:MAG TPA: type II secretion system F family protein [Actinomycetota bacterium]|nr:type II secretion system F family protein [Actinomycetota bacterium]
MKKCLLAAVALVLAMHAPAYAAEPVHIRRVDISSFPNVSITASVEGAATARSVTLTENGKPVSGVSIKPLSETGRDVDVTLVIDTSGSMKGEPIASAVAAALNFTTSLPDQVPVGLVTFADKAEVLVSPTLEHSEVLQELGNLKAEGETALYDGVRLAVRSFGSEAQHNLVLLSDGADTASRTTLAAAATSARNARVAVFSVGLTSGEFDASALKELSLKGGGRYSPASTADLSRVYQSLATELSSQYAISYESKHATGGQVTIGLATSGGRDSALSLVPKITADPIPREAPIVDKDPVLSGPMGLLVALGTSFGAIFVLLLMLLGTAARKNRERDLERRITAKTQGSHSAEPVLESRWVPEPFVQAAETVGEIGGITEKLERKLERADAPLRTGEFLLGLVLAGIVGATLGSLLLDSVVFSMLIAGVSSLVPFLWLAFVTRRRMNRLHDQLADILMIIASSLRAGHSFFQALDMVSKEIAEPGASEFGRVVAEVRLGRPIDDAMDSLAERIGSDDFKWALLAVNIQREVGGNLAEVLDTVAETIRDRDTIRRQIDVLTAEGRLSVAILAALPIGVALYMSWVNPEYIGLLFNTSLGLLMTAVACSLLTLGVFWMKKVVKIDV